MRSAERIMPGVIREDFWLPAASNSMSTLMTRRSSRGFSEHMPFESASGSMGTAAGRRAAAGKTRQLDVDHRAVEFRHARNAAAAAAALIEAARTHFLRKVRRQFVPRRNDDFVLDAGVVGENHVSLRAVTKQTHDRGVRAVQDANDAALGTLGAWDTAPPLDLHQNVVSVHDVFDGIAGDVYVAI